MHLHDAIELSGDPGNWTAKLIVGDPEDPCHRGTNTEFGVLYLWTMGHTVPLTMYGFQNEMPKKSQQEQCVCGEKHGFPKDPELLWHLHYSDKWEPLFEEPPLKSLARQLDH